MRPIFAAGFIVMVAACHRPTPQSPATETEASVEKARVEVVLPAEAEAVADTTDGRQPGDYYTVRFSGSYRDEPVEVTQRVVERRPGQLVVDIEMGGAPSLRLTIDDSPERRGQVLEVERNLGGELVPIEVADYEALMSELILTADVNEGLVDEEEIDLSLGELALKGTKSTFKVRIGDEAAWMSTLASPDFAWGDAGGEIKSVSGELLFRAEVIAVGHDGHGAMAAQEDEEGLEGLDAYDE